MKVVPYILATAGHVDHGKSALVRALTGTDPDRLPEEKARGITIDLGFAHFDLVRDDLTYRIGVVDVPGHEDFVKNMVAGVGSIDLTLLVVAADDGWMPQTEEHLEILMYLGVQRGVVALTKIDLAEDREQEIVRSIRERLRDSPLAEARIVPTSTRSGRGFDDLKTALAEVVSNAPPPRDIGKPRLPLDRAFTLKGVGTVVTGTLAGGVLRTGQNVIVQPGKIAARIRNLQSHGQDVKEAAPGSRVALNLPELEVRSDHSARGDRVVGRGDVVTVPQLGEPSALLDVSIRRSRRPSGGDARPLKHGALVQVHHGTRAIPARLQLFNRPELPAGETAPARLRLRSEAFALIGDRFVIRDWSEQHTLAGGIVLDPRAARQADRGALQRLSDDPFNVKLHVVTQLARCASAVPANLLSQSIFSRDEIDLAIRHLIDAKTVIQAGEKICSADLWTSLRDRAIKAVDDAHRTHPEWPGLNLTELRHQLNHAELFEPLVESLCREGFVRSGTSIRRATHAPALPPRLQAAGAALRKALAENPFEPPSRNQLAADAVSQQALKFLLTNGEAVEISPEVILSSDAFGRAVELVRQHLRARGPATVSELKTLLGSSRRIMVPLLEKLDRDGITRRDGDRRSLRQS